MNDETDLREAISKQAKDLWALTKAAKRLAVSYEAAVLARMGDIDEALALAQENKRWLHELDYRNLAFIIGEEELHSRELEFNQHGITRTFRFWKSEEIRAYLTACCALVTDLCALTPRTSFGFGAVLGQVRSGSLIEHDDDVDIIIAVPGVTSYRDGMGLVAQFLRERGYSVKPLKTHLHVIPPGGRLVDVFIGLTSGRCVNWRPGPVNTIEMDAVFPTSTVRLHGVECPFPRQPEKYLELVYGSSWRVPQKSWRHNWKASKDPEGPPANARRVPLA